MELVSSSRRRNRDCDVDEEFDLNSEPKQKKRQPSWKSTTTTIDDLDDSLLTDIFLRLPLIPAKRCQAVSKRWCAIISDPYFICRFDRQQRVHTAFLFHGYTSKDLHYDFTDLHETATVVASCKDLLLCRARRSWTQEVYYIYNPVTRDWAELPPPPPSANGCSHVGLMCDHNYDYYSTAAAAAAATSACKFAVVILDLRNSLKFKVHIFSSDTGEWRKSKISSAPKKFQGSFLGRNGIPFKGLLFWLSPGNGLIGLDPYDGGQLRRFIDVPSEFLLCSSPGVNEGFGVCKGRLRLFKISTDPVLGFSLMSIWDLEGYEEGEWILKKRVYFRDMVSNSKYSGWLTEAAKTPEFRPGVLGCEPDGSDVMHIAIRHRTFLKVVSCNLRMGTLEEWCVAPTDSYFRDAITCKLSWWPTPINSASSTRCLTKVIRLFGTEIRLVGH